MSESTLLPLELDAVSYTVNGQALLSDVSFHLEAGVRTIVLGHNGAGKSLLLRVAHGLLQPTSGKVRWATDDLGRIRTRQAMVFEHSILLRRSVAANVDYVQSIRGVDRAARRARTAEMLDRTGLAPLAMRRARVLSAGEQQRLALARAWSIEPEVLFLDEPTGALDPSATRSVEGLIEAIAEMGTKIVMTTHDLGQARRLADEILFFHRGRLLERSAADPFFERPESQEARAFLRGELLW